MIVNADEIIKNKPKDCKLCPKSLCEGMNISNIIHIYNNHKEDTVFPPCVDLQSMFLLVKKGGRLPHLRFSSLLNTIDSMLDSSVCELEEALQLTKIKNMI